MGLAWLMARAILFSLLGILLLIGFIVFRRWHRGRYFSRLNRRTVALREQFRLAARPFRLQDRGRYSAGQHRSL